MGCGLADIFSFQLPTAYAVSKVMKAFLVFSLFWLASCSNKNFICKSVDDVFTESSEAGVASAPPKQRGIPGKRGPPGRRGDKGEKGIQGTPGTCANVDSEMLSKLIEEKIKEGDINFGKSMGYPLKFTSSASHFFMSANSQL